MGGDLRWSAVQAEDRPQMKKISSPSSPEGRNVKQQNFEEVEVRDRKQSMSKCSVDTVKYTDPATKLCYLAEVKNVNGRGIGGKDEFRSYDIKIIRTNWKALKTGQVRLRTNDLVSRVKGTCLTTDEAGANRRRLGSRPKPSGHRAVLEALMEEIEEAKRAVL